MDFILFGDDLMTLSGFLGSNSCFSKFIADVFSSWHWLMLIICHGGKENPCF